jgi:hypothetical protein
MFGISGQPDDSVAIDAKARIRDGEAQADWGIPLVRGDGRRVVTHGRRHHHISPITFTASSKSLFLK